MAVVVTVRRIIPINQNLLVDLELLNQAFDFLHADLAANDQAEARLFSQKPRC